MFATSVRSDRHSASMSNRVKSERKLSGAVHTLGNTTGILVTVIFRDASDDHYGSTLQQSTSIPKLENCQIKLPKLSKLID